MISPESYTWSPSQIVSFQECARRWAFRSIAKIRTPQAPSAALGTETHKQLEAWLGGGQLDFTKESGNIAASGLQYLPEPLTPGMVLEGKFSFQSPDTGFFYNGYRDFYLPASSRPEGRPLVGDHKTTSNLRYAKTQEDLWTDPQAIVYARNEDTEGDVDLRWIYYQTRGTRKAIQVETTLPRPHVLSQFAKLELTAQAMRSIVDESRLVLGAGGDEGVAVEYVKTLPPNPSACEMYGGCPYRHLCQLDETHRLSSLFGSQLKSMEEKMTDGIAGLISRITGSSTVNAPPPPDTTGAAPALVVDHGPDKGKDTFTQDFINPPPVVPAVLDPALASSDKPTIIPPGPSEEDKPKRTRRTKAEMEAARAQEAAAKAPEQTPAPTVQPVATGSAPEAVAGGYTLYVDCLPSTPAEDAAHTLNVAKQAVCEKTGKPDYRLVDYGHGPGLLAMAMEDLLDQGAFKGDVFVSTQLQETHAVLEVLTRRATRVVRAVR